MGVKKKIKIKLKKKEDKFFTIDIDENLELKIKKSTDGVRCTVYIWNKKAIYADYMFYLTKDSAIALSHALETIVES